MLSTDGSGLAVLPPLAPAKYLATASAPENLGGSICVEISKKKSKQVSSFSLALKTLSPNSLTIEQMLAAAGSNAPSEHVQEFKGLVVEPTGMGVSGTVIQIFPNGDRLRDDTRAVKVITDANGRFSAGLAGLDVFAGTDPNPLAFKPLYDGCDKITVTAWRPGIYKDEERSCTTVR